MMSSLVIFDTFGETLKEKLDVDALEKYTKDISGVYTTFQTPRLNKKILLDKLNEVKQNGGNGVNSVVAVTGSRVNLETPLRKPSRKQVSTPTSSSSLTSGSSAPSSMRTDLRRLRRLRAWSESPSRKPE